MSYKFEPNRSYRMPTHFGPSLGPRQGPDGATYENRDTPFGTYVEASFAAERGELSRLVPSKFEVREDRIDLYFLYRTGIEWLAGRGYNEFAITVPVTYCSNDGPVEGNLLLVVWESLADAIITGREDLGVAKLYAEIPQPLVTGDRLTCRASWDGYEFASLQVNGLADVPFETSLPESESAGTFHHKYFPRTNTPGVADVDYVVLAPGHEPNIKVLGVQDASDASVVFRESTFQQLPTLVHIVNTLASLTIRDCLSACVTQYRGGKDLSDMRIVE